MIATLLDRLSGVKRSGRETWVARCPAHGDKTPSLSVRETSDGRVLLHCFAGCSANEVVESVGLSLSDLFPEPLTGDRLRPIRAPFPARDVLECVAGEALIVALVASAVKQGQTVSDEDMDRLVVATRRLQEAVDVVR